MKKTIWIASGVLTCFFGCGSETLSIGDLRCEGAGVRCTPSPQLTAKHNGFGGLSEPESQASLVWQADLPCPTPDGECLGYRSSLIVHDDGELTLLRHFAYGPDPGSTWPDNVVSITRISPDGALLWQNAEIPKEWAYASDYGNEWNFGVTLAADANGDVLLGVGLNQGGRRELSLYRIDDGGVRTLLFRNEGLYSLESIAVDQSDILVAGYYWTRSPNDAPNPELARYRRDGTLLWRQSRLRSGDDRQLSPNAIGTDGTTLMKPMPLAVDAKGRAFTAVSERILGTAVGSSVVAVGRDGNVRWHTLADLNLEPLPRLVLDPSGRPIVAGGAPFTSGVYNVSRLPAPDRASDGGDEVMAQRFREENIDPLVLGLTSDQQGRALVATVTGSRGEPRFVIDRYASNIPSRESFTLPDSAALAASGLPGLADNGAILGIRVGPDGDLYFWTSNKIGRVHLPDPSETAPESP